MEWDTFSPEIPALVVYRGLNINKKYDKGLRIILTRRVCFSLRKGSKIIGKHKEVVWNDYAFILT